MPSIQVSLDHITNILRLNALSDYAKSQLVDGKIEMGHARAVISLETSIQNTIIKQAVTKNLSVRAVEVLARNKKPSSSKTRKSKTQDTISLENKFSEFFCRGCKNTT